MLPSETITLHHIRPARPADAAAIALLVRRAYAPWIAVTGREPLPMRADYDAAVRAHDFALLESGDALLGLIETTPEADCLLIVNAAVDPAWHGHGIGQTLLAHAEASALSCGLPRIRLYTNALFARNLRLHAFLGYEVDREEPMNGGVAVHMSKPMSR